MNLFELGGESFLLNKCTICYRCYATLTRSYLQGWRVYSSGDGRLWTWQLSGISPLGELPLLERVTWHKVIYLSWGQWCYRGLAPCFNLGQLWSFPWESSKCDIVFVVHTSQLSFPWCYSLWIHAELVRKGDTFWLSMSFWTYFIEFNLTFKENEVKWYIFPTKDAGGVSPYCNYITAQLFPLPSHPFFPFPVQMGPKITS